MFNKFNKKKKDYQASWENSDSSSSDEEEATETTNVCFMAQEEDEVQQYTELLDAFHELYDDLKNTTRTTTKPFVPSIWGRLHEPKENYVESGTWISFLHSFLSSNMPSLRPLTSISCRITSIHVFFGLPCALLTCPKLICFTRRTEASVGLRRT